MASSRVSARIMPSTGPKHSVGGTTSRGRRRASRRGTTAAPRRRAGAAHEPRLARVERGQRPQQLAASAGSMRGPTAVPRSVAGPTRRDATASASWRRSRSTRPAEPTRMSSDGGGALLAGVPERRLRTTSATARSTSADGVTTSAFLPDVSARTSQVGPPAGEQPGRLDGPGEHDAGDVRVRDQPPADVPLGAEHHGEHVRRAPGPSRPRDRGHRDLRAARRLRGGLDQHGAAGGQRRRAREPTRDRDREVPRRRHHGDAARAGARRRARRRPRGRRRGRRSSARSRRPR